MRGVLSRWRSRCRPRPIPRAEAGHADARGAVANAPPKRRKEAQAASTT
jgi:hypothetical protein